MCVRYSDFAVVFIGVTTAACAAAGSSGAGATRSTTTISTSGMGMPTSQIETRSDTRGDIVAFTAAPGDVWKAVPDAYAELGIEVGTVDPENRVIGNPKLVARGRLAGQPLTRWVSCGVDAFGVPLSNAHRVELSVLSEVRSSPDGGTAVETRVGGVALRSASGANAVCTSTGKLERRIAQAIRERVGS